jgi:hypothetical protein
MAAHLLFREFACQDDAAIAAFQSGVSFGRDQDGSSDHWNSTMYANLLYSPSWKEKFNYNSPSRKEK